jgi:tetratricopeptide (TPR) repeat protein
VFERGDWKAAAELQVRPTKFPYVDAITYFARAVGAARSGNPTAAKADIANLIELRDKLKDAKDAYWSNIVDIQQQVASAWVLYAEGKYDEALNAMSAAAEAEDKTDKHPVTPGPLAPAREIYGAMLLDRGMAKEALAPTKPCSRRSPIGWRLMLARPKAPRPPAIRPRPENMRRRLLGSLRMPMYQDPS